MSTRDARVWLVAGLLLLGTALPVHAEAPGEREGRLLFQEATRLLKKKDYGPALQLYESAYARFPNVKILLNIGTTLRQLGRKAEAAAAYQRYLDDPHADPARRRDVERLLGQLDAQVGLLRIQVSQAEARLLVDGHAVPLIERNVALRIDPGSHQVRAEKPGYTAAEASVTLVAGEPRSVTLDLRPVPVAAPRPVAPPPKAPSPPPAMRWSRRLRVLTGLAATGGVIALAGAGVLAHAAVARGDVNSAPTLGERNHQVEVLQREQLIGAVVTGVGGALAIGALTGALVLRSERVPRTSVSIAPMVNGLLVAGTF